jgi:hypothetical protein
LIIWSSIVAPNDVFVASDGAAWSAWFDGEAHGAGAECSSSVRLVSRSSPLDDLAAAAWRPGRVLTGVEGVSRRPVRRIELTEGR